jgi:hypothetical protein
MDDVRKTAENVTYGVAFRLKSGLCGPETAKTLAARANRQAFQADSAVRHARAGNVARDSLAMERNWVPFIAMTILPAEHPR